jgi:hypothetical protein
MLDLERRDLLSQSTTKENDVENDEERKLTPGREPVFYGNSSDHELHVKPTGDAVNIVLVLISHYCLSKSQSERPCGTKMTLHAITNNRKVRRRK